MTGGFNLSVGLDAAGLGDRRSGSKSKPGGSNDRHIAEYPKEIVVAAASSGHTRQAIVDELDVLRRARSHS
jgi:hypothetical protein